MASIVYAIDKQNKDEEREAIRDEHRAHLKSAGKKLLTSGALLADDGVSVVGGLSIVDIDDEDDVEKFAYDDPYAKANIRKETQVLTWTRDIWLTKCTHNPTFSPYVINILFMKVGQNEKKLTRDVCQTFWTNTPNSSLIAAGTLGNFSNNSAVGILAVLYAENKEDVIKTINTWPLDLFCRLSELDITITRWRRRWWEGEFLLNDFSNDNVSNIRSIY
ncbi:MAG: hypothetical protein CMF49_05100 [Legionellales bacterium]|nr:hypothetical protein [Legionellales bacterium]|tara:strand:- start:389 stop:1045 length:657 start_codon:yes stop_codon:yes gene_type:complete